MRALHFLFIASVLLLTSGCWSSDKGSAPGLPANQYPPGEPPADPPAAQVIVPTPTPGATAKPQIRTHMGLSPGS